MNNFEEDVIQKSVETVKRFKLGQVNCEYKNFQNMSKVNESFQSPNIKVYNNLCQSTNHQLYKKTQIRLPQKTIIIEDLYSFDVQGQQVHDKGNGNSNKNSSDGSQLSLTNNGEQKSNPRKKKLIFKKKTVEDTNKNTERRNTKNVAKNFCKAFITYLGELHLPEIQQKMKTLGKNQKFNNRLVLKLSEDQQIKIHFKYFLDKKAQAWIDSSRILDKKTHKQAIKLYQKILDRGSKNISMQEFDKSSSSSSEIYFSEREDQE